MLELHYVAIVSVKRPEVKAWHNVLRDFERELDLLGSAGGKLVLMELDDCLGCSLLNCPLIPNALVSPVSRTDKLSALDL